MYIIKYQAIQFASTLLLLLSAMGCAEKKEEMQEEVAPPVTLMTVDPGHFHAAVVQKNMYADVDSTVHVFAPNGPDVDSYLQSIEAYNLRAENPTRWNEKLYLRPDFFEKMLRKKPGNVMVVSGNNGRKTEYIHQAILAGINVLADKPMVIHPDKFEMLLESFKLAEEKDLLLYDIMTERFEVTTGLQKALSQMPNVFGKLELGSPDEPAITKESVHHYFKYVSGNPLKRPAWFFDVEQQGEGLVDVTTHLVDLIFWECFPDKAIDYKEDIDVYGAKRWTTDLTPKQFETVTQIEAYPSFLNKYVNEDSILQVYQNGKIHFKVNGVHAKVSVRWDYEAPKGGGDTHYSIMRGTKANLVIRQGEEQKYKPTLYVEPVVDDENMTVALTEALTELESTYSGLSYKKEKSGYKIQIPEQYKVGHEAHFAQVTEKFLEYMKAGDLPDWEVPNMIAKSFVVLEAYKMAHQVEQ